MMRCCTDIHFSAKFIKASPCIEAFDECRRNRAPLASSLSACLFMRALPYLLHPSSFPSPSPLSPSLELGSYSLFQFRNLQGGKLERGLRFDCRRHKDLKFFFHGNKLFSRFRRGQFLKASVVPFPVEKTRIPITKTLLDLTVSQFW